MWLIWELIGPEELVKLVQRYQLKVSTLKQMAETKQIPYETFQEIERLMQEQKAVPM